MDGRAFDALLRSLTDSRRSLLGGSLAALGGLLGISASEAKKKKKSRVRRSAKTAAAPRSTASASNRRNRPRRNVAQAARSAAPTVAAVAPARTNARPAAPVTNAWTRGSKATNSAALGARRALPVRRAKPATPQGRGAARDRARSAAVMASNAARLRLACMPAKTVAVARRTTAPSAPKPPTAAMRRTSARTASVAGQKGRRVCPVTLGALPSWNAIPPLSRVGHRTAPCRARNRSDVRSTSALGF